jgi:hypothetical protein
MAAKRYAVHPRRPTRGAREAEGMGQDVVAIHLVVQEVEPKLRLLLRLHVERPLQPPNTVRSRQAHANLRVLGHHGCVQKRGPFPPPALPGFCGSTGLSDVQPSHHPGGDVESRDPSPRRDLPRCPENRAHVPLPIPRRTLSCARVGCSHDRRRPSPSLGRVGVRVSTFEACSGFTRVTARALAHLSMRDFSCSFDDSVTLIAVQDATESNRQLLRWIFHPLVLCAFVAHQLNSGVRTAT